MVGMFQDVPSHPHLLVTLVQSRNVLDSSNKDNIKEWQHGFSSGDIKGSPHVLRKKLLTLSISQWKQFPCGKKLRLPPDASTEADSSWVSLVSRAPESPQHWNLCLSERPEAWNSLPCALPTDTRQ